jgi:hypothetical protein
MPLGVKLLALGGIGVILLGCTLASELLVLPLALEPLGRALFRLAFLTTIPFRVLVSFVIPSVNHHWPLGHLTVACLGTPYFLYAVGKLGKMIPRRRARRRQEGPAPVLRSGINRRQFLFRSAAGVVSVGTGGLGTYASLVAPSLVRIRRYAISVRDLPRELDGVRIVHVSDTHYGPYMSLRFLEEVVDRANRLNGDLMVLTGDYVHMTSRAIERGIGVLAELRSRFGSVAVLGNHEHWEGVQACRAAFDRIGVPLIDNDRLFLTPDGLAREPRAERCLCVAGVGDLWEDQVLFDKALLDVPAGVPRVVLSHNPDAAELVRPDERIDLMLSGHTHGGQVVLPVIGPPVTVTAYGNKYLGGLCRGPHCPVLVSRGVGLAGIPMRLNAPPEIAEVWLKRA